MKRESNTDGKKTEWWSIGVMAGKRTGFSRIGPALTRFFPHKSMQVVDFPRMCNVSIFWGGTRNSGISGRGIQTELGTKIGKWGAGVLGKKAAGIGECGFARKKLRIVTRKSAKFQESPRKFAQIRPVNPRLFGLLRVGAFFGESTIGPPPFHTNRRSTWGNRH